MPIEELTIGIDLGTSNSCVAAVIDGKPRVLEDENGNKVHASMVYFDADGNAVVGNRARVYLRRAPRRTVVSAKRLMGRFFFSDEVRKANTRFAYELVEGPNSAVRIKIDDKLFSPQEIGGLVLRRLKEVAERALGQKVHKAVVTVPAYFNDNQRQATRDAGKIAGLEVLRIINEPTAAALAYGYGKGLRQRLVVYDLGGGTFDVSVLDIGDDIYEVLSTAGDTYLGGDDIDERIVGYLANIFFQENGIDLREDELTLARLNSVAEACKKKLASDGEVRFDLQDIAKDKDGNLLSLEAKLNLKELGRMMMDLIQRTFKVCDEALQAAHVVASDLDGVILVGGPTRLPTISQAAQHYFGKAAEEGVDPDEVVALGAALQAHALSHDGPPTMLLDVTPLTLRIATVGGFSEGIIAKNTPIPIEKTRTFTTVRDNQESVRVRVLQGEDREVEKCVQLGEFEFSGLTAAPRGAVEIEVCFEIDANGIVNVSAKDVESGRVASTTITLSSGLSAEDISASQARTSETEIIDGMAPKATS